MSIQLWHRIEEMQKRLDDLNERVRIIELRQDPIAYMPEPRPKLTLPKDHK